MARTQNYQFSVQEARDLIKDCFHHKALIYWTDFLVFITIGYAAAGVYLTSPLFSWQQIICYFVAGFALFRVGSFIHEIVHMSGKQLLAFRVAWNIIAGIPMLMPSFFYRNHIDHHSQKHYGTGQDGEYLPLGSGMLREVGYFYLQVVFLPAAVFMRFFLITPISFLHPRLRTWALERTSFFVINLHYRQAIPTSAPRKWWAAMEIACCLRAWAIPLAVLSGAAPYSRIGLLYALAIMTLGLNYIRNLVAHRYASTGNPISHVDQLADSVNIDGVPILTELFFPLYLRYHALHHLFPTLPYHNLKKAHRRLVAELPADSLYHSTIHPGFWSATRQLIKSATIARCKKAKGRTIGADIWYERRNELVESRRQEAPGPGRSTALS